VRPLARSFAPQSCGGNAEPKEVILDLQRGLLTGGDLVAGTPEEKTENKRLFREVDLFQCLSCGAWRIRVSVGIEHVGRKILDLRAGTRKRGPRHERESGSAVYDHGARSAQSVGHLPRHAAAKLIDGESISDFRRKTEWLFWLGCGLSFDPHGQAVALAMKQILNASGVSWGVLRRETCCGEPARRAGNEYLLVSTFPGTNSSKRLGAARVKNIVSCDRTAQ